MIDLEEIFGLGGEEDLKSIADSVRSELALAKTMRFKGLTNQDLLVQIEKLQKEVQGIKRQGISMWNYKSAVPKIFDVVDGAFFVMTEVVKKLEEKE